MSDENRNANVVLTADTSRYDQSMASAEKSTNAVLNSVIALNSAMISLTNNSGKKLELIGAGTLAGLAAATTAAAKLQSQMSQLQANSIMTGRSFEQVQRGVNSLRSSFGITTESAVALTTQLSKMGQSQKDLRGLSETMIRLGAVTGEAVSGLTEGLITLQRQMNVTGEQYTKRFASALATVSANAGVSATSVLSFANSIAPIGRVAGMSTKEIMGFSTAFVKSGQDGYAAANAFNKMLTDITRSVQYGSPALKDYSNLIGVSVDQFKAMPRAEAMTRVFEEINKQGPDAIKTLERFGLDGIRTYRALQAAASTGGIRQAIADATKGYGDQGDFLKASDAALNGLNENLQKMQNNLRMIGEAFGKGLVGPANAAASALNALLAPMGKLLAMTGNIPGLATAGGALGILGAGALLRQFGRLTTLGLAATAFRGPMAAGVLKGGSSSIGQRGYPFGDWVNRFTNDYEEGKGGMFQRGLFRVGMGVGSAQNWLFNRARENVGMGPREIISRSLGAGVGMAGQFMRYGLEPLYTSNLINPMNRKPMFTSAGPAEYFREAGGIRENIDRFRNRTDAIRAFGATEQVSRSLSGFGASLAQQSTLFRSLGAETIKLTASLGRATLGTAGMVGTGLGMGALRVGGRVLGGIGSGIMGLLGGPIGLASMTGLGVLGLRQGWKAANQDVLSDTSNNSPISRYAAALGVATNATVKFAQVVETAAQKTGKELTLGQATTVTAADTALAKRADTQFSDSRVASMNKSQALSFAQSVMSSTTISPEQANLLKLDLIKRFDEGGAQSILDQAKAGGAPPNLFSQVNRQWRFGPFTNQWKTSGNTKAAAKMAGSDLQARLEAVANRGMGVQSQVALTGFNQAAAAYKNANNDRAQDQIAMGLARGLGIPDSDTASIDAIKNALSNYDSSAPRTGLQGNLNAAQISVASSGTLAGRVLDTARRSVPGGFRYTTSNFNPGQANAQTKPYASFIEESLRNAGGLAQYITGDNKLGRTVNTALREGDNANAQYRAAIDVATTFTKISGSGSAAINELERMQRAIGSTTEPLYQMAAAAMQFVRQQQSENMPNLTRAGQAGVLAANYAASRANAALPGAGPESAQQAETDRQALVAAKNNARDFFQQIVNGARELRISSARAEEDIALSRTRAYEDFNRMRSRAEFDYHKQRTRALYDYHKQQSRAQYDFNLSRRRQEEDFNHQIVLMARNAAQQVYDIYTRITVKQTWSATNLLQNTGDQQRALTEQVANLRKVRSMGVSGDVIRMLGLNQTENAQQLARFVSDLMNDPKMAAAWNKAAKDRLAVAKKLVTDKDNEQWTEMRRSFNLNITRSQQDFNRGLKRQNDDFATSMRRQEQDFNVTLARQQQDLSISLSRMREDLNRQLRRAAEDFNRAAEDLTQDFETLAKKAIGLLSGTAKRQAQELYHQFDVLKRELPKKINAVLDAIASGTDASANAAEHRLAGVLSSLGRNGSANSADNKTVSKNIDIVKHYAANQGWTGRAWNDLYKLIMGESGFNNTAQNPSSSAYGIFQFLDSTWASVGAKKTSDPVGQTRAGIDYIRQRYGNPTNAYNQWQHRSPHWYAEGSVFAGPQIIGVGEKGPEAVLPLNHRGAEFVMSILKMYMGTAAQKANVGRNSLITPSANVVNNYRVDRSTNFNGEWTVVSNDPAKFMRQMQEKKRMDALIGRTR